MSSSLDLMLGRTIYRIRQCHNLSQTEVARRAGISQATISFIEKGRKACGIETLRSIASSLDTTASGLLAIVEEASTAESVRDVIIERAQNVLNKSDGWLSLDEADRQFNLRG